VTEGICEKVMRVSVRKRLYGGKDTKDRVSGQMFFQQRTKEKKKDLLSTYVCDLRGCGGGSTVSTEQTPPLPAVENLKNKGN